jgi:hypothetical protein
VWLYVSRFLIQLTGGLMMNQDNGDEVMGIGKDLYMMGVGVQQLFMAVLGRFHVDMLGLEREIIPGMLGKQWV